METTSEDVESRRSRNFALGAIEAGLSLEPLLQKAEWFNEDHPVKITEKMLLSVPGVTENTLKRFRKIDTSRLTTEEDITRTTNEYMNPFRGNSLTLILPMAKAIFEGTNLTNEYTQKAKAMFGDKTAEIQAAIKKMFDIIAYRKNMGHQSDKLNEQISDDLWYGENASRQANSAMMVGEIKEAAQIPVEEIKAVYALGRLARYVINSCDGVDTGSDDVNQLLENVLQPLTGPTVSEREIIAKKRKVYGYPTSYNDLIGVKSSVN